LTRPPGRRSLSVASITDSNINTDTADSQRPLVTRLGDALASDRPRTIRAFELREGTTRSRVRPAITRLRDESEPLRDAPAREIGPIHGDRRPRRRRSCAQPPGRVPSRA
jgi:hypothetical protein